LRAVVVNDRLLQLKSRHANASFATGKSTYTFAYNDLFANIQRSGTAGISTAFSAGFCGGKVHSGAVLDFTCAPSQISAQGRFEDVDIEALSATGVDWPSVTGRASGVFAIQGPKDSSLSGTLRISGGNVSDLDFLPWNISKAFAMPSLTRLTGVDLACDFRLDGNSKAVKDVLLHSDQLREVKGFYSVDSNDLVSSRISAVFSETLFKESAFGQKIVQLVPAAWELPVEVRLTGSAERMNLQWEDSTLKKKVESRLPDFVERIIQRRIDRAQAAAGATSP
jgi:hypothetical protein